MNEKNALPMQEISSFPSKRYATGKGLEKSGLTAGQANSQSPHSSSLEMEDIVNRLIVYFKKNLK